MEVVEIEQEKMRNGWERGWISLPKENGALVSRRGGPDKVAVEIFKEQYLRLVPSGNANLLNWGCRAKLKRPLERNDGIVLQVCVGEGGRPRVVGWCLEIDYLKAMNSLKKPKLKA